MYNIEKISIALNRLLSFILSLKILCPPIRIKDKIIDIKPINQIKGFPCGYKYFVPSGTWDLGISD